MLKENSIIAAFLRELTRTVEKFRLQPGGAKWMTIFYSESTYIIFKRALESLRTTFPTEILQDLFTKLENGKIHDVNEIFAILEKFPE